MSTSYSEEFLPFLNEVVKFNHPIFKVQCDSNFNYSFNPNFICKKGYTLLHKALRTGNIRVFIKLICMGADITIKMRNGSNLLGSSCYDRNKIQFLKIILNLDLIDVNIIDDYGNTPLMGAVEFGNIEAVKLLFNKYNNIDLSIRDKRYNKNVFDINPLHNQNKIKSLLDTYKIQTGQ